MRVNGEIIIMPLRAIYNPIIKNNIIIRMHQQILGITGIDHINGNGLDNRRCNLRSATNSQNQANRRKQKNTSSIYKGVTWNKHAKKWLSQVKFNYEGIYLGLFISEIDAAIAYNAKAKELFGEYARINII
jgi:hypothetical protein